jgi:hypothetical protein
VFVRNGGYILTIAAVLSHRKLFFKNMQNIFAEVYVGTLDRDPVNLSAVAGRTFEETAEWAAAEALQKLHLLRKLPKVVFVKLTDAAGAVHALKVLPERVVTC